MKQKHKKGNEKDKLTAAKLPIVPLSIINPCKIGIKAPPTIAITNPAAPKVESSSLKPLSAIPYIVGNIKDINAEVATRKYSPIMPSIKITPEVVIMAQAANMVSNFFEFMYFIKNVLINLLDKNIVIATIL